jgi:UDP-N-acetylmuramoyl-L-alanyl-D-glutamate--2,6-diaminopimelate ligase
VRRLGYAARAPDPSCRAIPLELFAPPDEIVIDEHGTHARLAPSSLGDALGGRLDLLLVGAMHVENALAAALAGHALGHSADAIRTGLSSFGGVEGRFQVVHRRPFVVVDYAHTPDALVRTLSVARSLVAARQGKVLCVFGCGGDRDPGKRSEMGAVASTSADVVVVTNDNPRNEDPAAIADAIERGARKGAATWRRILDRRAAIGCAVGLAGPSDIVVIAGKGHEKTQVIGSEELPFDDVVVAQRAADETVGSETAREGNRVDEDQP